MIIVMVFAMITRRLGILATSPAIAGLVRAPTLRALMFLGPTGLDAMSRSGVTISVGGRSGASNCSLDSENNGSGDDSRDELHTKRKRGESPQAFQNRITNLVLDDTL